MSPPRIRAPITLLAVAFLAFSCSVSFAQSALEYHPMKAGNRWEYRTVNIGEKAVPPEKTRVEITGTEMSDGVMAYIAENTNFHSDDSIKSTN